MNKAVPAGHVDWKDFNGDTEVYLQVCKDRGLTPKFPQFTGDPNYYKLLLDRKLYNNNGERIETKPVRPIFDMDAINTMLTNF